MLFFRFIVFCKLFTPIFWLFVCLLFLLLLLIFHMFRTFVVIIISNTLSFLFLSPYKFLINFDRFRLDILLWRKDLSLANILLLGVINFSFFILLQFQIIFAFFPPQQVLIYLSFWSRLLSFLPNESFFRTDLLLNFLVFKCLLSIISLILLKIDSLFMFLFPKNFFNLGNISLLSYFWRIFFFVFLYKALGLFNIWFNFGYVHNIINSDNFLFLIWFQ